VVTNWWYRNATGGGPEHDIAFCVVVPKWTGTETDHPVVPKWSGTERYLPRITDEREVPERRCAFQRNFRSGVPVRYGSISPLAKWIIGS